MKRHKYRRRDESRSPAELKHSGGDEQLLLLRRASFLIILFLFPTLTGVHLDRGHDSSDSAAWWAGRRGVGRARPPGGPRGQEIILLESSSLVPDRLVVSPPWQPLQGRRRGRSRGQSLDSKATPLTGAASPPPSRCRAAAAAP